MQPVKDIGCDSYNPFWLSQDHGRLVPASFELTCAHGRLKSNKNQRCGVVWFMFFVGWALNFSLFILLNIGSHRNLVIGIWLFHLAVLVGFSVNSLVCDDTVNNSKYCIWVSGRWHLVTMPFKIPLAIGHQMFLTKLYD